MAPFSTGIDTQQIPGVPFDLGEIAIPIDTDKIERDLRREVRIEARSAIAGVIGPTVAGFRQQVESEFRRAYALDAINGVDLIVSTDGGLQFAAGGAAHERGWGLKGGLFYGAGPVAFGLTGGHGRSDGEEAWIFGGSMTVRFGKLF
ncbi:MAG: hypothetical protein AAFV19_24950 [Pseudomonadota bacterium]